MNRQQRRAAAKAVKSSSDSPAALFEAALRHLQSGRFAESENCCRQILAANPQHADSFHLLGLISVETKKYDQAIEFIAQAIRCDPNNPDYLSNLGIALQRLGRLDEAIKSYDLALSIKPDSVETWLKLGHLLEKRQHFDQALLAYDRALEINPHHAEAANHGGLLLFALERYEEALARFDRLEQIKPGQADTCYMRGLCLDRLLRYDEASVIYRKALEIAPDLAEANNNLGIILRKSSRDAEALACFDKALQSKPAFAKALNNRGLSLSELRRFEEALASFSRASSVDPEYADAHFNAALVRLLTGDLEAGWVGREWRWKVPALGLQARPFTQPLWLGDSPLAGKTILLHNDEGFGDAIQFARYVPMVAALGARVILEVNEALRALLSEVPGVSQCLAKSTAGLPDFDFHCPLASLPLAFRTRVETIPSAESYLPAPTDARRQPWESRLGPRDRPRVGLVWSGNPDHKNDRNRSLALSALSPILDLDVTFVSLQKNVRPEDKVTLREIGSVRDIEEHLLDFTDTAALVSCVDLVISVDTSVAHLAGALGCPVWILLPYSPEWRWLLDRDDSPWYPSARLFRQTETRQWPGVLARVRAELQDLIAAWRPV